MFGDMSFCCISKWNWSDEYSISGRIQKCGEGGKGAWVLSSRSRGSREGVGAGGPNSEDGVGAGGPKSEDGVGAGAREKIDAVRNMSMKRRRD